MQMILVINHFKLFFGIRITFPLIKIASLQMYEMGGFVMQIKSRSNHLLAQEVTDFFLILQPSTLRAVLRVKHRTQNGRSMCRAISSIAGNSVLNLKTKLYFTIFNETPVRFSVSNETCGFFFKQSPYIKISYHSGMCS